MAIDPCRASSRPGSLFVRVEAQKRLKMLMTVQDKVTTVFFLLRLCRLELRQLRRRRGELLRPRRRLKTLYPLLFAACISNSCARSTPRLGVLAGM